MRIGEVAKQAGVNIQTLRYYERRGLLPRAQRGASGYRTYDPDTVGLVRFIRRAQELGFTLREIGELIQFRQVPRQGVAVRTLAAAKLEDIERKIHQLMAMRDALGVIVDACECENDTMTCPIIEALEDPGEAVMRAEALADHRE